MQIIARAKNIALQAALEKACRVGDGKLINDLLKIHKIKLENPSKKTQAKSAIFSIKNLQNLSQ